MSTKSVLSTRAGSATSIAAFALVASGALSFGCSSDNPKPSGPIIVGGSGGGDAGPGSGGSTSGSGGGTSTGGGNASGGKAGGSGGAKNVLDGGDAGPSSGGDGGVIPDSGITVECNPDAGANGCYPCPPTTAFQYLNQCTGSQCQPFDNAGRLGVNWNGGDITKVP